MKSTLKQVQIQEAVIAATLRKIWTVLQYYYQQMLENTTVNTNSIQIYRKVEIEREKKVHLRSTRKSASIKFKKSVKAGIIKWGSAKNRRKQIGCQRTDLNPRVFGFCRLLPPTKTAFENALQISNQNILSSKKFASTKRKLRTFNK